MRDRDPHILEPLAREGDQSVDVRVEGHRDSSLRAAPGDDVGIAGGPEAHLRGVDRVHPPFPQEGRRTPGHVLVQEDLHEAVLISTLSSPSIAAA